jgi:hypothetical protein
MQLKYVKRTEMLKNPDSVRDQTTHVDHSLQLRSLLSLLGILRVKLQSRNLFSNLDSHVDAFE